MFEILLLAYLSFPTIIAVLQEKERATFEDHVKASLVLGTFGLILSAFAIIESAMISAMGLGGIELAKTVFPIPAGFEILYPVVFFISMVIWYGISAILAKAYFALERYFKF